MRHLCLALLATAALCAADAVRDLPIVNGAMSEGADVPTGWTKTWTGAGKLAPSRDTKVFKKGPASLCLATDGDAKGNVHQMIDVAGGSTIAVGGWLRTEGTVKTLVFVQSFDADWKPIDYQTVKVQVEPTDWSEFSGKVVLPAAAARVAFGMQIDGNGKAWLDELHSGEKPAK